MGSLLVDRYRGTGFHMVSLDRKGVAGKILGLVGVRIERWEQRPKSLEHQRCHQAVERRQQRSLFAPIAERLQGAEKRPAGEGTIL